MMAGSAPVSPSTRTPAHVRSTRPRAKGRSTPQARGGMRAGRKTERKSGGRYQAALPSSASEP